MSVEISFPLEFIIEGVPLSLRASPQNRQAWMEDIRSAARPHLPEGHWATEHPVHLTVFYFLDTEMDGDLDNILKPILDALSGFVCVDDGQVERILIQRFEGGRIFTFDQPSAKLAEAVAMSGYRVYIKIEVPDTREHANDKPTS